MDPQAGRERFTAGRWRATTLAAEEVPELQRFFEANPGYFRVVNGEPPAADAAQEEFEERLPAEWPHGRRALLAFRNDAGEIEGMADIVSDLFATHVWHIGLFIVATALHGSGAAQVLYGAMEQWMEAQGARWIRLGVVQGNARAEAFWESLGYVEVRHRQGIEIGRLTHTLRVMVKPMAGASIAEYLVLVQRDRPGP